MKRYCIFLLIVCVSLVFISCLSPYKGDDEGKNGIPGNDTPIVISELFMPFTGGSGNGDGFRFYTNDSKYRAPSGYTLWTCWPSQGEFTERTVSMQKRQGEYIAGYGMVICSDERVVDGVSQPVFLTVMINNNGKYAVGKVVGSFYKSLQDWRDAPGLTVGSVENTVTITRKDEANPNKYNLYFNGVDAGLSFNDSEEPRCNGYGRNGYIVVISPLDLNASAVEVLFYE